MQSVRSPLEQAILEKDVEAVLAAARRERPVGVEVALAIVVVLAESGDVRFEAWSRRWVERLTVERQLQPATVEQVQRLVALLPTQGEARAVEVALRSYAAPARTWG